MDSSVVTWRRKPDGRPFADADVNGVRLRASLLLPGEGRPYPDDAACEARYIAWLENIAPALAAHKLNLPVAVSAEPEPGNPTLAALCAWYVETVMVTRGNAEVSRSHNVVIFRRWLDYLAARGIVDASGLRANPSALDALVRDRLQEVKPGTARKEMVKFRAVLRAALSRRLVESAIIDDWPDIRRAEPDYAEPITPAQFSAFLCRLRDGTVSAARYGRHYRSALYNVVRFIAFVGCRPSDACLLTRDRLIGLDGPEPVAFFRQAKTRQLVSAALSPPAVEAIRDELSRGIKHTHVFLDRRGKPWSAQTVQSGILWHARQLGIKVTAKSFRQSVVSSLLSSGAAPEDVARITGHRSDALYAYYKRQKGARHALAARHAELMGWPETTENPG